MKIKSLTTIFGVGDQGYFQWESGPLYKDIQENDQDNTFVIWCQTGEVTYINKAMLVAWTIAYEVDTIA